MSYYAVYINDKRKKIVYTSSASTEKALELEGYVHIFSSSLKHMVVHSHTGYEVIPGREWDGDNINIGTAWYDLDKS